MASFARQQVERAALVHVFLKQLARTVCEDESLSLFHSPHAREYARLTCQIMTEDVNHQLLFFDQVKKRGGIETIRRLMRDELTYDMLQKFLADWKEPFTVEEGEELFKHHFFPFMLEASTIEGNLYHAFRRAILDAFASQDFKVF